MTPVTRAPVNGLELAYDTFGDPEDPTALLVMGLGAQMINWDEGFCALMVARGFHVVRFDNRDIGQSSWIETPDLDPAAAVMAALAGEPVKVPYLLSDMAADAVGLLDHLGIDRVHVVGASMGGMIAQSMAVEFPERVASLTSVMSTTGEPGVGAPSPEVVGALLVDRPTEREASIEASVDIVRTISHPDHFDEVQVRERSAEEFVRGVNPMGVPRQLLAILASGSRAEGLAALDVPTLVVHGREDPLVTLSGGLATAEAVPGADLLVFSQMGHDIPELYWPQLSDAIFNIAARGEGI